MHYYTPTGVPTHWVQKKDGSGNRPTTVADCRKLGLLPSVTTITSLLDKPALTAWKVAQGIHAVVTAPDLPGEGIDAKIARVLEAREHEREAEMAADLGTAIHAAIEAGLRGESVMPEHDAYVKTALTTVASLGKVISSEKIVVGEGYAGKMDCLVQGPGLLTVLDFKTCKKLPTKDSWTEHQLQTAAYAAALGNTGDDRIQTGNLYLSTITGESALFTQDDWQDYADAFMHLLGYWYIVNRVPRMMMV